ncbi:hypothetical protein KEH56_18670 (plasmid) [Burkholderia cenocepacia]|uniref:hypothetical protein n=1 Tax=Burkholderia cepacia complex TaxID=87882 RepID=UPI00158C00E9|nr:MULTISPECIES: hypothetical protein [Burkholderia cepacia complex]MDN7926960.1 hypothetical protein [Burkholderia vietnamiensis]QUN41461.1 hypothetical protein KEH56_18670 [Burkholderia cenocepacia]QUO30760.1 hypothetical protein KEH57_36630 [Burkholderia cenocepacia]
MLSNQPLAEIPNVATTRNSSAVRLNRMQILQLLALAVDESTVVTVQRGAVGHSGAGLYAWDEEYPDEGASFLDPAGNSESAASDARSTPVCATDPVPQDLHPRTADLVRRFHIALASKLANAEHKYGYADSWAATDWMDECREQLLRHVAKGDPLDVGAYCAFLWHHGEPTVKAAG